MVYPPQSGKVTATKSRCCEYSLDTRYKCYTYHSNSPIRSTHVVLNAFDDGGIGMILFRKFSVLFIIVFSGSLQSIATTHDHLPFQKTLAGNHLGQSVPTINLALDKSGRPVVTEGFLFSNTDSEQAAVCKVNFNEAPELAPGFVSLADDKPESSVGLCDQKRILNLAQQNIEYELNRKLVVLPAIAGAAYLIGSCVLGASFGVISGYAAHETVNEEDAGAIKTISGGTLSGLFSVSGMGFTSLLSHLEFVSQWGSLATKLSTGAGIICNIGGGALMYYAMETELVY